jgi:hypothetical protein
MAKGKLPLPNSFEAAEGRHFNVQIPASDAPATVDAQGLPPGLKVGRNGAISGTPRKPGHYEVTIVEKRTRKITINVSKATSILDKHLW